MRLGGLVGLCILSFASQALVACDDSGDRKNNNNTAGTDQGGSSDVAGTANGGEPDSGGSKSQGGSAGTTAGTFTTAGTDTGGTAGTDTGGTAGTGGTANPACTTDAQCEDNNPCTDDACTDGQCVHTNNTDTCDDGNVCTSGDACSDGACKGVNNDVVCDDLSSCTSNDKCAGGVCRGTKDRVACPSCDDAINIIQNCDFTEELNHWEETFLFGGGGTQEVINQRLVVDVTAGGTHVYDVQPRQTPLTLVKGMKYKLRLVAGASVDRDIIVGLVEDGNDYTVYSKGETGGGYKLQLTQQAKFFEKEFTMTDPTDAKVKFELDLGGTDVPLGSVYLDDVYLAPIKCTGAASCDDGNVCTDDACDVDTGICSYSNNTATCATDDKECTTDICAAGVCTHPAMDDDTACTADADDCTADVCTGGLCTHDFDPGVCDCQIDAHCDDHEVCTDDHCNAGACEYTNNTAACDDGELCTSNDVCGGGTCGGTNNTDACDDNDPCTIADTCGGGTCGAGTTDICLDCTAGGNLLANCNLSNGDTGWLPGFFDGGAGTQMVTDGALVVNITDGSDAGYKVQPRQEGITLVQGTTYHVTFSAQASIPRGIVLSITQNGGNYTSYSGAQTFNLTTEMKTYSFDFTMNAAPPGELVKFELDLGGQANNPTVPNTVTFDNFYMAPKL